MYLKDKNKILRVRLSYAQFDKLGVIATAAGMSVSDLVRQLIDKL